MTARRPSPDGTVDLRIELCQKVLKNDILAITRVSKELSEDECVNGVKYFEGNLRQFGQRILYIFY